MKTQNNIQNNLPANRNWEIAIWIFGIVVLALLFSNTNALAFSPKFEEEVYIDDIPFDTEKIVANYYCKLVIAEEIDFEDETYIDDIPFNTELISYKYVYSSTIEMDFEMEDENYIDDIPFDTYSIAKAYRQERCNSQYVLVK